ncbi:MAG: GTP 3',8-cyclase MoaA, partial [Sporichthyaceae bacterium]|nr:GTP 3',8-cyclase MoaA [Sporichthyaceae bacterium]
MTRTIQPRPVRCHRCPETHRCGPSDETPQRAPGASTVGHNATGSDCWVRPCTCRSASTVGHNAVGRGGRDVARTLAGTGDHCRGTRHTGGGRVLIDRFGRVATDLRVSLTDKCNLRCTYCMPAEGLDWLPKPQLLTDDEIVRLVTVAVQRLGVTEVRFTGGEPLVRKGLVGIVERTAALRPSPQVSLTTNGLGLAMIAKALAAAGLHRVNVSLDTLRPERFLELTRRDRFADVVKGLAAAKAAGLDPVKVNTVLMRGVNDDEASDLLAWALDEGYALRFIEQMPLDPQHGWDRETMLDADEILEQLARRWTLTPVEQRGSAPAEEFLVNGGPATVGV